MDALCADGRTMSTWLLPLVDQYTRPRELWWSASNWSIYWTTACLRFSPYKWLYTCACDTNRSPGTQSRPNCKSCTYDRPEATSSTLRNLCSTPRRKRVLYGGANPGNGTPLDWLTRGEAVAAIS